jgi:hypothetical protein
LKLNCTHQLLVYADDINTLGGIAHTIKKKTENVVAASKDIGLEVNAEKTKHLVWSRDQNAGRSHNIKSDNLAFEGGNSKNIWDNLNESKFNSD